jgi:hypothetical protein
MGGSTHVLIAPMLLKWLQKNYMNTFLPGFDVHWLLSSTKVPILSTMLSNILLIILSLDTPILLFIIHKEMDKLNLLTRFLEPY